MDVESLTDNATYCSIFYNDFPAFPEFQCLSTSSSSSSSFSSSWDVLKSDDTEEDHHAVDNRKSMSYQPSDSTNGMDGISDTWDDHDYFSVFGDGDRDGFSTVFGTDDQDSDFQHKEPEQQEPTMELQGEASKDLAMLFLEWLKSNKDSISAENLRKVKLKRSTIESAITHFGGGKEGMKRLLKLILEWVQNHHLRHQGKRMKKLEEPSHFHITPSPNPSPSFTEQNYANIIVHSPPDHNTCFTISNWNMHQPPPQQLPPLGADSTAMSTSPGFSSTGGHMSESVISFNNPYPHTNDEYCATARSPSQVVPCATKEARQKRMARQKRVLPHHRHNQSYHGQHNQIERYQNAMLIGTAREKYASLPATASQDDPANWVYWP